MTKLQAARQARIAHGIETVKRMCAMTIAALEKDAARDGIEEVDSSVHVQTIDVTCDTDEWIRAQPGPWRRFEVTWQEREVSG